VLVTGGAGWLGQRVVLALAEGMSNLGEVWSGGHHVRCLVPVDQPCQDLRKLGVDIVRGDLRDAEACAAFTARAADCILLHLAGIIHPPGRTWYFDAINYKGTVTLYEAARLAGVARIVAISSNSPIGYNADPYDIFDEESPYRPYMGYGKSKWRMELSLRERAARNRKPEITILRTPWFYGPGQPLRQTRFFTLIKNGRFPIFGSGENRRSMGYVDSLVQGILLAATTPAAAGEIFWLADGRPYPMQEIIETVRVTLKEDFGMMVANRVPRLPGFIADVARFADQALQGAGLYQQEVHVLSEMNLTIACSIDKARRMLGYDPKIVLREGMRRSIEWCLTRDIKI
jgi:nucleoside-diphosphate-sugar epimerase